LHHPDGIVGMNISIVNTASNIDGIIINIVLNHIGKLDIPTTIFPKKLFPTLNLNPKKSISTPILCDVLLNLFVY
jgi:hypothetical protein